MKIWYFFIEGAYFGIFLVEGGAGDIEISRGGAGGIESVEGGVPPKNLEVARCLNSYVQLMNFLNKFKDNIYFFQFLATLSHRYKHQTNSYNARSHDTHVCILALTDHDVKFEKRS